MSSGWAIVGPARHRIRQSSSKSIEAGLNGVSPFVRGGGCNSADMLLLYAIVASSLSSLVGAISIASSRVMPRTPLALEGRSSLARLPCAHASSLFDRTQGVAPLSSRSIHSHTRIRTLRDIESLTVVSGRTSLAPLVAPPLRSIASCNHPTLRRKVPPRCSRCRHRRRARRRCRRLCRQRSTSR